MYTVSLFLVTIQFLGYHGVMKSAPGGCACLPWERVHGRRFGASTGGEGRCSGAPFGSRRSWTCSSCHPMVDITGSTKRPFGPLQEFAVDAVDGPHLGVAQEIEYRPRTWGIFGHEPAEKNDGQYWSMNLNFLPIRPSNPVYDTESRQSSSFLGSVMIRTHSRWIWSIGMILKNRCPSLGVERCWLHGRLWCVDGFIQGIFPFEFEWFFPIYQPFCRGWDDPRPFWQTRFIECHPNRNKLQFTVYLTAYCSWVYHLDRIQNRFRTTSAGDEVGAPQFGWCS